MGSALPVTAGNNYLVGMGTLTHVSSYSYVLHFMLVSHLNRKIWLSWNQGLFQTQKEGFAQEGFCISLQRRSCFCNTFPANIPDLDLWAKGQHTPECGGRENWKLDLSIISPAKLIEHEHEHEHELIELRREQHFRAAGVFLWRCQDYLRWSPHSLTANWLGNKNKGMEMPQLYWRHLIT